MTEMDDAVREAALTIVRARRRFERAVLAAFEEMTRQTQSAWAVLSMAAVDEAVEHITRADEWPEDEYEQERTVQVVANRIAEQWLKEAEKQVPPSGRELPPLVKRLLEEACPENN